MRGWGGGCWCVRGWGGGCWYEGVGWRVLV